MFSGGVAADESELTANPDITARGQLPARADSVRVPTAVPKAASTAADNTHAPPTARMHSASAQMHSTSTDMDGATAPASAPVTSSAVASTAARLKNSRWDEHTRCDGGDKERSA
jgi:hypothetical protein